MKRRCLALERCEAREVFDADLTWQSGWQNPVVPADVVPDGIVAPSDLLRIANSLAAYGEHALTDAEWNEAGLSAGDASSVEYLDVTGDRRVTREDFVAVLEVLEQNRAEGILLSLEESTVAVTQEAALTEPWALDPLLVDTEIAEGEALLETLALNASLSLALESELQQVGSLGDPAGVEFISVAPFLECVNLPATAGPIPTMVSDDFGNVYSAAWRPAWTPLNDLANEGLIIDDFDSPYIAWGNWQAYTDDEHKIAPKFVDAPFVDDSHFAWLEIVGYRSYLVGTNLENFSNATSVQNSFDWQQTVSVTTGSTFTNTLTVQVGAEIGGELDGIAAKIQGLTSGSLSISHQLQTTSTVGLTIHETVPACTTLGLYKMARVVELQVDYAYMDDTALGPMYGYMREMGRGILRSTTDAGHRNLMAHGDLVPVATPAVPPTDPIAPGPMYEL